ncbi:MAG TPA: sulfotransferase [Candidatus Bathyarchaeia archaeon]|nr:sulfotransferase [Candidatus Bathyarchaeia archaeon]
MKKHWIINRCPLAGASTSNIWRLLFQNKFRVHPKYWPRLGYSMLLSSITTPLRIVERLRFKRKVKKSQLEQDPIFIIGHWRSGTTFLHYLFAQDTSKGLVSNIEVYAPNFFLAFPKFTRKLIVGSLPETRPMDDIKISADLPGEEEHSLGAIDKYGFFHSMIFPRNFKTYSSYKSFDNAKPKDLERWKKRYEFFIKKVAYKNKGKRMLLKNPANTYRVKHLIKMYPNAKFIHLYRNPYEVYASTIKFHNDTCEVFSLQTWNMDQLKKNIIDIYKELYVNWDEKIKDVPKENWVDIKYEDFIKQPFETIKKIYSDLKLTDCEESQERIQAYLDSEKDYKPREYTLTDELITQVNENCDHILKRFGYEKLQPSGS